MEYGKNGFKLMIIVIKNIAVNSCNNGFGSLLNKKLILYLK